MLKKIGMSALGLIAVLAYWTITGDHSNKVTGPSKLPAKFLNGGNGALTIEADSSTPAVMRYTFHGPLKDGKAEEEVTGYEDLEAGHYSWSTEIAPKTGVYLELEAKNPQPGAKLNWTIKLNGQEIDTQNETMEQPLKANEAFFIQLIRDDVQDPDSGE